MKNNQLYDKYNLSKQQLMHLPAAEWLIAGGRRTGRSYLLAVVLIEKAIHNKGVWIEIIDHSNVCYQREHFVTMLECLRSSVMPDKMFSIRHGYLAIRYDGPKPPKNDNLSTKPMLHKPSTNEGENIIEDEPMMKWFEFDHLPSHPQDVSIRFYELACSMCAQIKKGSERTIALRKLLESKDAAVRARVNPGM